MVRSCHTEYSRGISIENPSTYHSKVIAKVKVFVDDRTEEGHQQKGQKQYALDLQSQGHKI
jgi:hypothetical protein